jgi:hypothetical protein
MGLHAQDVMDLTAGWKATTTAAMQAIAKGGGWVWQMFKGRIWGAGTLACHAVLSTRDASISLSRALSLCLSRSLSVSVRVRVRVCVCVCACLCVLVCVVCSGVFVPHPRPHMHTHCRFWRCVWKGIRHRCSMRQSIHRSMHPHLAAADSNVVPRAPPYRPDESSDSDR